MLGLHFGMLAVHSTEELKFLPVLPLTAALVSPPLTSLPVPCASLPPPRIFRSNVLLSGVRTQHATLYATHLGKSRLGVLQDAADFFALFNGGMRGGQRRYFTYSLMPDSLRCSETGAGFFTDFMSKHAMHAGGAEEVLFAGEVGQWVGAAWTAPWWVGCVLATWLATLLKQQPWDGCLLGASWMLALIDCCTPNTQASSASCPTPPRPVAAA